MKYLPFFLLFIGMNLAFAQHTLPTIRYEGESCALVDAQFKSLTPYKYAYIEAFQEGFALATLHTPTGKRLQTYLNVKGQELTLPTENQLFPFVQGRAIFKEKESFGFLDKFGRAVVPATYKKTHNYSEGLALVLDAQDKHFFINEAGEIAFEVPKKYGFIDAQCTAGLVRVCELDKNNPYEYTDRIGSQIRKGFYSFLDKAGKVVLDLQQKCPLVIYANPFQNRTSIVMVKDTTQKRGYGSQLKMGVIDIKGDWVILPMYELIERQGTNYLVKETDDEDRTYTGLYDYAGKKLLPCTYKNIYPPVGDLQITEVYKYNQDALKNKPDAYNYKYNSVFGLIDTLQNIRIQPKYKDLWLLPDKHILVNAPAIQGTDAYKLLEIRINNSTVITQEKKKEILEKLEIVKKNKDTNWLKEANTELDEIEQITASTSKSAKKKYQIFDLSGKPKSEVANFIAYTEYDENDKTGGRQTLFPILFGKKWALANVENKTILTEWVDSIAPFNTIQNRQEAPMLNGKKWTFMQQTFDNAYSFGDGAFTAVKKGKKWAMMHKVGKETTSYQYDSIVPVLQRVLLDENVYNNENFYGRRGRYNEQQTIDYDTEVLRTLLLPTHHFLAYQKNKWGVIDGFGKVITPFENDSIVDVFYNYLIVKRGDKQGVIDYAGKTLVSFQRARIDIINDLAYLHQAEQVSLYNLENELLTPNSFDKIEPYTIAILRVTKEGKIGWIDTEGKEIFPPIYESINPAQRAYKYRRGRDESPANSCYILKKDNKEGLANKDFKVIVPCEYEHIDVFRLGGLPLIIVEKDGKKGIINFQNQLITPILYEDLTNIYSYQGKAKETEIGTIKAKKEGKLGLMNEAGKFVIALQYDILQPLSESNKIFALHGNTHEVFENTGKLLFSKTWTAMSPLENYIRNEDMLSVQVGKKWGFVRLTGETVIPFTYAEVMPFTSFISGKKYAKVRKGKRWGVIDIKGNEVIPCQYEQIDDLKHWQSSTIKVVRKGKTEQIEIKDKNKNNAPAESPKSQELEFEPEKNIGIPKAPEKRED